MLQTLRTANVCFFSIHGRGIDQKIFQKMLHNWMQKILWLEINNRNCNPLSAKTRKLLKLWLKERTAYQIIKVTKKQYQFMSKNAIFIR